MHRSISARLATTLTAGAVVLATAACGGQSLSNGGAKPSAGSNAAPAVALDTAPAEDKAASVINAIMPDPALSGKVPSSVKSNGLKMTSSLGYPPMEMFATDGKTAIGLDPSLGRAIARKLGVKIKITDVDFNAQIPGIGTGRYDILMSSMTDNKTRQEKVSFVDYVQAGAGFIVKKGNPEGVKLPTDMCGKTVSVVDNGSSLKLAQTYDSDCKAAGKSGLKILKFTGDQDALLQVSNGRAQANITDYVVAAFKASDPKLKLDAVAIDGTESPFGVAMDPKRTDLIGAVQGALDSLIKSGEYGKVLGAWDLNKLAVTSAVLNGGK